ncbi:hypothetical protein C5F48_17590 [Cereibacter changlensis JA139]|uniref:Uncharacterized protein n=2 Tax=Cereibacter changlensis TaxID=402884 RepID=A0A2T4JRN8_9RHOB|nr:hypothetical protein [Cereibacter changlensis]PTE20423.1 hypothetical protein C5F48_17590 [Cereibacter changlensis JA139]PZX58739.1 hypothetical protein LX76_00242 [Cereibacter changlensis]
MSGMTLTATRLRAGIWEAVLEGVRGQPALEVTLLEAPVGFSLTELPDRPGTLALRVPLPVEALSEGVQTVLVRDAVSGATLGHVSIIAGAALEEDLRAEIDLLRAELDMLKRAFRRHCLETA